MKINKIIILSLSVIVISANSVYSQDDDSTRQILKQGLLGAGTGAIAAGASGGRAGQGALIGAGTGIIGSALLDALTGPPASARRQAPPSQDDYYYADQPQQEYYEEPPQESATQKVLKQGLVGAGTGALASGMSGGNAGQGALIGAGTSVIGSALLDTLTQPSQPRRVYRRAPPPQPYQATPQAYQPQMQAQNVQVQDEQAGPEGGKKKIVKHYDANGKLVSEEEIYY